ncbi:glycosyltransferase family 4 protein [Pseudoalteromonas sp. Of7M-16]|uniref:glycosyltransferase family 4 protein n=1 Tax=Pseudoalteromonas sp. Of7M-16 TaxID=2917756 RepID=UPI001EF55394|nr:glycosyltransferase family 4 protein [Pseudoalteromonas sp. Of7M-16]MCG7547218.1 glycosyltransferase family 4 protein [Pseudoalteromonas sp. Of7M-16]
MKKMLFISPREPVNVAGGGLYKTKRLLAYFREKFHVKEFYLTESSSVSQENIYQVKINDKKYQPTLANLMGSYIAGVPLSVYRNTPEDFDSKRFNELASWADIIFVDHFFMYQFVPDSFAGKIIFHEHNAEFNIWERRASIEGNILKSLLLKREAKRVFQYEKKSALASDLVFAAPNDIACLKDAGCDTARFATTYHLGEDSLLNTALNNFHGLENNLVFLGGLDWEPNFNGVLWFLENCWDTLRSETNGEVKLHLIGKISEQQKVQLSEYSGVVCLGFVDDLNDALSQAKVFICPLQFGSGMKVKNITACYKGLPVVTTSIGAESIEFVDGENCLIADQPREFVDAIRSLLDSNELCAEIGANARAMSEKQYSWEEMLNSMYLEIIK